jgi:hypothetical protein
MTKISERIANLEIVLEETCRHFRNGGDHETRKHIARKLMQAARKGTVTLDELRGVAGHALAELSRRKSA